MDMEKAVTILHGYTWKNKQIKVKVLLYKALFLNCLKYTSICQFSYTCLLSGAGIVSSMSIQVFAL